MDSAVLKVFITSREAKCDECRQELGLTPGLHWPAIIRLYVYPAPIWITWFFFLQRTRHWPGGLRNIQNCRRSFSNGAGRESDMNGKGCWLRRKRWRRPKRNVFRMWKPGRGGGQSWISSILRRLPRESGSCFLLAPRAGNGKLPNMPA
jgi:hypothetical protein